MAALTAEENTVDAREPEREMHFEVEFTLLFTRVTYVGLGHIF